MTKKFPLILIAVIVVLLGSVLLNIYLTIKNNELNTKINGFIPAAVSMEDENNRLRQQEIKQQAKIDELMYFKDSVQNPSISKYAPLSFPSGNAVPTQEPLQTQPGIENTQPTFKDLNKGNR